MDLDLGRTGSSAERRPSRNSAVGCTIAPPPSGRSRARRARFYRDVWNEAAAALGGDGPRSGRPAAGDHAAALSPCARRAQPDLARRPADGRRRGRQAAGLPPAHRARPPGAEAHVPDRRDDLRRAWRFVVRHSARRASSSPRAARPVPSASRPASSPAPTSRGRWPTPGRSAAMSSWRSSWPAASIASCIFDGELLDAVRRRPADGHGDGRSTSSELIAAENERRLAGGIEASQSLIKIDGELRRTLRRGEHATLRVRAAPPESASLLKNIVNDNRREDNVSAASTLRRRGRDSGRRKPPRPSAPALPASTSSRPTRRFPSPRRAAS